MPAAVPIITAVAAVASAGSAIYQGNKQDRAQRAAVNQAKKNAADAQAQADIDANKANQKRTDAASVLSQAQQQAAGAGSTMLTGAQGVDPNKLKLGGSSLLGG